jgi:hypothetical protein
MARSSAARPPESRNYQERPLWRRLPFGAAQVAGGADTAPEAFFWLRSDHVRRALVSGWLFYYWGRYYPGQADSEFYWSGALAPKFRAVASLGPGYDQSAIRDRPPLVVPRDDGRRYQAAWEELLAMQPRPWFVHLETWNEYFEGSDIAESQEFGRTYIDLTRQFADRFHQS